MGASCGPLRLMLLVLDIAAHADGSPTAYFLGTFTPTTSGTAPWHPGPADLICLNVDCDLDLHKAL